MYSSLTRRNITRFTRTVDYTRLTPSGSGTHLLNLLLFHYLFHHHRYSTALLTIARVEQ